MRVGIAQCTNLAHRIVLWNCVVEFNQLSKAICLHSKLARSLPSMVCLGLRPRATPVQCRLEEDEKLAAATRLLQQTEVPDYPIPDTKTKIIFNTPQVFLSNSLGHASCKEKT